MFVTHICIYDLYSILAVQKDNVIHNWLMFNSLSGSSHSARMLSVLYKMHLEELANKYSAIIKII